MSPLPFELQLALRYLRPKRTFVSVITLISVIGVMLGVAVLIIVISVMSGFDKELRDKILGFKAHMRIAHPTHPLKNYQAVEDAVNRNKNVRGVAPFVMGPVLLKTQPLDEAPQVHAPIVRGIDPEVESKVTNFKTNMVAGTLDLTGNGIVMGL